MENEFAKVMSKRTDEELIKIVTVERAKYKPAALEAAEIEIKNRNIDAELFDKLTEQSRLEKEKNQVVKSNAVGSEIRFLNFIIDIIVLSFIAVISMFFIGLFIPSTNQTVISVVGYTTLLGSFIAYYSIMEIKFQKTVGKFITKTKVVKIDGDKPTGQDIIARTLFRLIPFDRLSFLFVKNGFHDYLSKTKVIRDQVK